jgi:ribosomal protein S24E
VKFNVIEEKENPLLKRKELLLSIDYEGGSTPSKSELQKFLAEQLNANMENLEISKVLSEIGLPRGKAWVKIWEEKKIPLYSEKKKKEAEKAEEEPKTEEPKEEVEEEKSNEKEEPKQEEKSDQ